MDEQLRSEITKFLVILLPILGAMLTTWWQNKKTRKDLDACFDKQRAVEREIGIETHQDPKTRSVSVTSRTTRKVVSERGADREGQGKDPGGAA